MKNVFRFFLSTLLFFGFFSCTQLKEEFGSINFNSDNIIRSVARESSNIDNVVLNISLKLSGAVNEEISRDILISDIGSSKTVFNFEEIPIGQTLYIDVQVKSRDVYNTLLYSGSTSIESIHPGQNSVSIGLDYGIRFLLWNENKENPSSSNFRLYDGLNQNSLIGDKSNRLLDFTFDKFSNLYTLECIDRIDTKEFFVNKYSYAAPDVILNLYHEVISNASGEHLTYSCLAVNDGTVYIGANDYGASEPNYRHIKRVTGKNTSEIVIPKEEIGILCPEQIEFDDKGNLYVLVRGADCPIYKFAKEGQTFVKKIDGDSIFGVDNPNNFKISDIQIQGNYLYVTVFRQMPISGGGPEKAFGGGVIPVDISNNNFVVKSIVGFDEDGKNAVLEKEAVTNDYFYHPVKFISRDNNYLYVADDGFYTLSKLGYNNVQRNVNRVVTLSLANPGAPVIEKCQVPRGFNFKEEMPEEKFELMNRYLLWTSNNYALLDNIKGDLDLDQAITNSQTIEPLPREVKGYEAGTFVDFHIDKNYNLFDLMYDGSDHYIIFHDYDSFDRKKSIKLVLSETPSCIASDGTYVYIAYGTKMNRYNISTAELDNSFIFDTGIVYKTINAIEFDDMGNLFVAANTTDNSESRILKYSYEDYHRAPLVSGFATPTFSDSSYDIVKEKCIISDMQVIGDKLYVLRRYAYGDPNINVSSGELEILKTSDLNMVYSKGFGLKPNFSMEPLFTDAPTTETPYFYGPQKFVARKPDEIVIADDGILSTTDEANSIVTYGLDGKFKSRIVLSSIDFGNTWAGSSFQ